MFSFTLVTSEDDEEEAQSSQLHQRLTEHMETEADGEDCGGPEPDRNSDPESDTDETIDSSEPDTDDSDDWKETEEPQSGLNSLNNEEVSVSGSRCSAGEKPFGCSECWKRFRTKGNLKKHMFIHTRKKPFNNSVCRKIFVRKARLSQHMPVHTGQKQVMCHRRFVRHPLIKRHKCFGCHPGASCGKKPFRCSECGKGFGIKTDLQRHIRIHAGEKPFSCSVCKKSFTLNGSLQKHLTLHRKGKRFRCSVCKEIFACRCVAGQSSQLHQTEENREAEPAAIRSTEHMEKEADGEDCGGPKQDRNSDPVRHPEPDPDVKTEPYSEPNDSVDVEFWRETRKHQSGFTYQRNKKVSVKDGFNSSEKPFGCSDDEAEAEPKTDGRVDGDQPPSGPKHLKSEKVSVRDTGSNTDMKPFSSSESQERPEDRLTLLTHQKPFRCSVCNSDCSDSDSLVEHMRIHMRRTRFRCPTCGEEFAWRRRLTKHMEVHTKKKLYTCRDCDERFTWYNTLRNHRCVGRHFSRLHQTQTEENQEAEPAASSSTEHMETEADGEDCGGPEPDRNSGAGRHPEPDSDVKTEPDNTVGVKFWRETRRLQPGFTYQINTKVFNSSKNPFGCSDDEAEAEPKTGGRVDGDQPPSGPNHLKSEKVSVRDTGSNTDMKPFSSSESQERPEDRLTLLTHQSPPTGEKPFLCSLWVTQTEKTATL
ncbi:zinc finger protein ZFP2-like [Clinocottus analis]|uniref:zinc finger protein ZFP2-like n=1 Tax=Clinocottus analis TaxID=304258 RepID=UPI0035C123B8